MSGGYQVRVSLLGQAGEPVFIRTTTHYGFMLEVEYAEPIRVLQSITAEFDPVSDLALDIINQGGVQTLRRLALPSADSQ